MFCVHLKYPYDDNPFYYAGEVVLTVGPFKEEQTAKDFAEDVNNISRHYSAEVKPLASMSESFNFLNGIKTK